MKMIVYILIAPVLLVAGLYGWGLVLPEEHVVEVSREIWVAPDVLFARLIAFEEHPKWRRDVKSVVYDRVAQRVVEKSSMGELPYRVLKVEAARLLETEIDGGRSLGFGGTWRFHLAPAGGGTTLTITERGQVYSPMFRVMGKLFFAPEKTAKNYLEDLAESFEK